MGEKELAIICDLDGTLCNAKDRRKYIEQIPKDFEKFYAEAINDEPNWWCKHILAGLSKDIKIIIVTGRPAKWKDDFIKWAEKWGIGYDAIFARPDGDFRQDFLIKQQIYDDEIKNRYNILFCLDDRKQVVDMWRRNGLVCLQCDEGEF